jgi:hypothetical protein
VFSAPWNITEHSGGLLLLSTCQRNLHTGLDIYPHIKGSGCPTSRILLQGSCDVSGCRVMSENALSRQDFRELLVEACGPKSVSVGVGWGQRAKSNWRCHPEAMKMEPRPRRLFSHQC